MEQTTNIEDGRTEPILEMKPKGQLCGAPWLQAINVRSHNLYLVSASCSLLTLVLFLR